MHFGQRASVQRDCDEDSPQMDGEDRKLQRRHRWLLGHLEPKDVLNEANMSLPEPEQRAGERTRLGPGVGCGGGRGVVAEGHINKL